jgi:hypothetical protein
VRIRTGLGPQDWTPNEPAAGRFHGVAAWGTRNATVIGGMVPVVAAHLRTPETMSSRAARLRRESRTCGVWMARANGYCARASGHKHFHQSREAMDNAARKAAEARA